MINILHSIDTPGPGGAETVYLDIIDQLDRTRFNSFPVISAKGWLYDRLQEKGITPLIITSKGSFNFGYLLQLIQVIRKQNIDLIHSHLFGSNVYCSLAGILTSTPVISTFHGFVDVATRGKTLNVKTAIINKGSKKIIFVSNQLKNHFVEQHGIKQDRAEVIYNGVDLKKFKPNKSNILKEKLGIAIDDVLIGSIGNIRPAKRYDLLLHVATVLKAKRRDVKFVIAGHGEGKLYQDLIALRDRLEIQDTVFFLGFIDDTVHLLHEFDIFILCSASEGFSISLIEAMASGLPVIATKCGGPEEIISSGFNGILVGDPSVERIVLALERTLSDFTEGRTLNKNAKNTVLERFTDVQMIESYSDLYSKIIGK